MYLTYIDESGKAERSDPEPEYVLASLTINESSWKDVDNRIRGLKQKYFPNAKYDEVEIHATDIFNHKGAFKNMALEKRLMIFRDMMEIVSEVDCSISAVLIRKDELKNKSLEVDSFALKLLFERLCYYYNVANGENRMKGNYEQYGILMIDSVNQKYDHKIRMKVRNLFEDGTEYQKNQYLIEDPIFVDSSYRHLSQLVDCVAYCIRRNFRKSDANERERETFRSYFELIEPKLLRNGSTSGYGLKTFPRCQITEDVGVSDRGTTIPPLSRLGATRNIHIDNLDKKETQTF